jgi:hypothetical protein
MSNGQIGNATTLSYSTTENGSYADLAEVLNVDLPGFKRGKVDMTSYDSPDHTMEYISSVWKEMSDIPVEIIYVDSQEDELTTISEAAEMWFKITLKNGTYFGGPGFISDFGGSIPNKDKVTRKMTITPTGHWGRNGGT